MQSASLVGVRTYTIYTYVPDCDDSPAVEPRGDDECCSFGSGFVSVAALRAGGRLLRLGAFPSVVGNGSSWVVIKTRIGFHQFCKRRPDEWEREIERESSSLRWPRSAPDLLLLLRLKL
eukprot:GHVU01224733.1.p1 GENE.GHVU01224733.1~~GHVU01224733.1.p1  ORF type:complete len:119 (-),score=11.30 GHVU01224733.1:404-760(-)